MIQNKQNLNEKELELANIVENFLIKEGFNNIEGCADWSKPTRMKFANRAIRLDYRIKPEEPDCEEQLQVSNIIIDSSMRGKGTFKRLMDEFASFCQKHTNMPIMFTEVVNEKFAESLLQKYKGILLHDSEVSGKYIAILPEKY